MYLDSRLPLFWIVHHCHLTLFYSTEQTSSALLRSFNGLRSRLRRILIIFYVFHSFRCDVIKSIVKIHYGYYCDEMAWKKNHFLNCKWNYRAMLNGPDDEAKNKRLAGMATRENWDIFNRQTNKQTEQKQKISKLKMESFQQRIRQTKRRARREGAIVDVDSAVSAMFSWFVAVCSDCIVATKSNRLFSFKFLFVCFCKVHLILPFIKNENSAETD